MRVVLMIAAACLTPIVACRHGGQGLRETPGPSLAFLGGWAIPAPDAKDVAGLPSSIVRIRDGARMVLVPEGTFRMGAKPREQGRGGPAVAGELTRLAAFYVDEREVSNAQFLQFVQGTSYQTSVERRGEGTVFVPNDPRHPASVKGATWRTPSAEGRPPTDWESLPAVLVSWDDAERYAGWVMCALPAEAQFEYALRSGVEGELYPWGGDLPPKTVVGNLPDVSIRRAWPVAFGKVNTWFMPAYDDGHPGSAPCGAYSPNGFGVYDLEGNVMEWCRDVDPGDRDGRAARGGSWRSRGAEWLRASERHYAKRDAASDEVGFRCARAIPTK